MVYLDKLWQLHGTLFCAMGIIKRQIVYSENRPFFVIAQSDGMFSKLGTLDT